MLRSSIKMNEDRAVAASVSTSLPSESDGRLNRYVLSINISSTEPSPKVVASRKNISIMSVNQDSNAITKPFTDGNLSDDQKLVLSVTDNRTSRSDMKLLCGSMKGIILSGKCSPYDEHFDSGTCSDAEVMKSDSPQPPPLPPKMRSNRQKNYMLTESFCSDTSSASSSDSVQTSDLIGDSMKSMSGNLHLESPQLIRSIDDDRRKAAAQSTNNVGLLPTSLLIDIRNRSVVFHDDDDNNKTRSHHEHEHEHETQDENEMNYSNLEPCNRDSVDEKMLMNFYSDDSYYKFHINEHLSYELDAFKMMTHDESDESFAGLRDLRSGTSTIRSKNGTIRGIKNRVRSGISTFLQMQQTTVKNYKDKDGGKIVLYITSMGVVRSTYAKCQTVKKILNTLMVKYEERDVFMSNFHQQEIRDRMESDEIDVPQLFVDGQYIGNADQVERFNEMGELRKMLKSFKCLESIKTCRICGGFNMLPCSSCGGSKKSIHRNHFTSEFVALKCMACDEVGLVRCYSCCS